MKLFKRKMGKKMKTAVNALADGIECGAKLHPRVEGKLAGRFGYDDEPEFKWGTCALGAAAVCYRAKTEPITDAVLKDIKNTNHSSILALYSVPDRSIENMVEIDFAKYPGKKNGFSGKVLDGYTISEMIWRLNDWYHMSREDIARFLRDLE